MNAAEFFSKTPRALRMLAQFRGRDSRAQFWPYAAVVFIANQAASVASMVPWFFATLSSDIERIGRLSNANSQDWAVEAASGDVGYDYVEHGPPVMGQAMPDFSYLTAISGIVFVLSCVLLASAVTRRLHDRGHKGLWALVPVVLGCSGLIFMTNLTQNLPFDNVQAGAGVAFFTAFITAFLSNALYIVTLIVLMVHLALPGSSAPNAYGPPPGHTPNEEPA